MSELKLYERLIDRIKGVVIVRDAYDGYIKFEVEKSGEEIWRSVNEAQKMKPAPPKSRAKDIFNWIVFLIAIGLVCTATVFLSGKVVIHTETEKQNVK